MFFSTPLIAFTTLALFSVRSCHGQHDAATSSISSATTQPSVAKITSETISGSPVTVGHLTGVTTVLTTFVSGSTTTIKNSTGVTTETITFITCAPSLVYNTSGETTELSTYIIPTSHPTGNGSDSGEPTTEFTAYVAPTPVAEYNSVGNVTTVLTTYVTPAAQPTNATGVVTCVASASPSAPGSVTSVYDSYASSTPTTVIKQARDVTTSADQGVSSCIIYPSGSGTPVTVTKVARDATTELTTYVTPTLSPCTDYTMVNGSASVLPTTASPTGSPSYAYGTTLKAESTTTSNASVASTTASSNSTAATHLADFAAGSFALSNAKASSVMTYVAVGFAALQATRFLF